MTARPAPTTFYREIDRNRRNSWILILVVALVLAALGAAIGYATDFGIWGVVVALGVATGSPAEQAAAEGPFVAALRQLFAVVENYPDLKANQNVLQLQEELTTTENQIGFSRQHYNATVRELNTSIQTFPNVLIAGTFGFRERDYFQIEEADAAVPEVNLRTT